MVSHYRITEMPAFCLNTCLNIGVGDIRCLQPAPPSPPHPQTQPRKMHLRIMQLTVLIGSTSKVREKLRTPMAFECAIIFARAITRIFHQRLRVYKKTAAKMCEVRERRGEMILQSCYPRANKGAIFMNMHEKPLTVGWETMAVFWN